MGRLGRPTLTTERLVLEPLTEVHLEHLVALDGDADVMEYLTGRAATRDEVLASMARRTRADADDRGLGYWVGSDRGRFLGWWCLSVDDADPTTAELGYRLRQRAWGHGYATEGSRALLTHAFDTVGLASVWAETMAVNVRSRAVMERLGMRHVLTEVRAWKHPLPGADEGEVRYELSAGAWRATYHDVRP